MIAICPVLAPMRPARLVVAPMTPYLTYHYAGGIGTIPVSLSCGCVKHTSSQRTYMHAGVHHVISYITNIIKHQIQTYKQRRSTGAVLLGWVGGENLDVQRESLQIVSAVRSPGPRSNYCWRLLANR